VKHTIAINQNFLFRRLYKQGKCYVTPYVAVYAKKTKRNGNRLGITATKKIGNAVQRNRARRIIKEAYRLYEDELPAGFDYVIVARQRAVSAKMQNILKSLKSVRNKISDI